MVQPRDYNNFLVFFFFIYLLVCFIQCSSEKLGIENSNK